MKPVILLLYSGLLLSGEAFRSFPQDDRPLQNGASTHELFAASGEYSESAHTLYLKDLKGSRVVKVASFGRHIDVGWSKDGVKFFMNDWMGSNRAECKVARIEKDGAITWLSLKTRQRHDCESVDSTDHCYLTCSGWSGVNEISGWFDYYGDGGDVREHVTFQVGN